MCESVDYSSSPIIERFGIAGFDSKYKWILFFDFNSFENEIGSIAEIIVNPMSPNGQFEDKINIIDSINSEKVDMVICSATKYLSLGTNFAKVNPPAYQEKENIIVNK